MTIWNVEPKGHNMRVRIEQASRSNRPGVTQYVLRIQDGYRAGHLVSTDIVLQQEYPMYWNTEDACLTWAAMTGYTIIEGDPPPSPATLYS